MCSFGYLVDGGLECSAGDYGVVGIDQHRSNLAAWPHLLDSRSATIFTANCTRKQARSDSDPCGAVFPHLPIITINI